MHTCVGVVSRQPVPLPRIIKNIFKNGIVCRDIKTEKAQEQDWDGTLATKLNLTTST